MYTIRSSAISAKLVARSAGIGTTLHTNSAQYLSIAAWYAALPHASLPLPASPPAALLAAYSVPRPTGAYPLVVPTRRPAATSPQAVVCQWRHHTSRIVQKSRTLVTWDEL